MDSKVAGELKDTGSLPETNGKSTHLKIDGWFRCHFLLKVRPFSGAMLLVLGRVFLFFKVDP